MFPYEITPIEGRDGEELKECFRGEKLGFVHVGPKKWVYPANYAKHAEKYYTFDLKKDDLWIMTFPKSGTTWTQEILWLINNDLDYETAAKIPLTERFPFIEFNMIYSDKYVEELTELNSSNPKALEKIKRSITPGYEIAESMESPRHLKTHLPPSLMPPSLFDTCKVVCVARNPYDVAVSFYHHSKLLKIHDFQGDFNKYWDLFEKDLIMYSSYWEHLKELWELKDHPNALFLWYEDLKQDLPSSIRKICDFLDKEMTEDEIKKLVDHVQIDNFRKNVVLSEPINTVGAINTGLQGFIRRGKVGGNKEFDDKELKRRADKWFEENFEKTNVIFPRF